MYCAQTFLPSDAHEESEPVVPDGEARERRKPSVDLLHRQFEALYTNNLMREVQLPPPAAGRTAAQRNWSALRIKVRPHAWTAQRGACLLTRGV